MAEPELGGIWRRLPHEATSAEFARWDAEWAAEARALERYDPQEDYVRTEGIDFITNTSAVEQKALFAQLEQSRQSQIFGDRAALDPELRDSAEQQRKFEELGNVLDREGLQPSPADFERAAQINELARIQQRWGELDRLGVHPDRIEQIIGEEFPKSSYGHDYDFEGILARDEKEREALVRAEHQRPDWYRETQAGHNIDLKAPQRFPLTDDGLVAHRIIADGPFNGPDIGAELTLARYRDWQHQERKLEVATPDILERTQAYVRDRTEGIQQQQRHGELLRPVQQPAENTEAEAANLRLKPHVPRV